MWAVRLLEGIMMNGPLGAAMSVRMPDGRIYTQIKDFVSVKKVQDFEPAHNQRRCNLYRVNGFGYKCLMESAELSMTEEELAAESSKLDKRLEKHLGPKLQSVISAVGMVLGVLLSVALFYISRL